MQEVKHFNTSSFTKTLKMRENHEILWKNSEKDLSCVIFSFTRVSGHSCYEKILSLVEIKNEGICFISFSWPTNIQGCQKKRPVILDFFPVYHPPKALWKFFHFPKRWVFEAGFSYDNSVSLQTDDVRRCWKGLYF